MLFGKAIHLGQRLPCQPVELFRIDNSDLDEICRESDCRRHRSLPGKRGTSPVSLAGTLIQQTLNS
jgi:hypothetical protein